MMSAALVNLVCDFLFVGQNIAWVGGAAGAAWATTFSQYAALIFFMRWLQSDPNDKVNGEGGVMRLLDQSSKGILHGHMKFIDLIKFPKCMETLKKVWTYFVPVTTTSVGRVSGYIAMSHVVSSAFGTVHMAAQQIVLAFFLCFIPMCDSLNLTAQSFVPGIYDYTDNYRLRLRVMKETIRNFLKAGVVFGVALTAIVMTMPFVSHLFSNDPAVIASVNSTTPYLAMMFALSGIVCSGEGLLLGQKDLSFLSNTFGAFFFILPLWLLRIKQNVLSGVQSAGLGAVWRVFSIYQITRCILWLARLFQLIKRDEKVLLEQEK
jgi:Na+-driven multidrug efflux pump